MNFITSAEQLLFNTPLLRLDKLKESEGLCANIFIKLESFNPAGSVKDRVAFFMLEDAQKRGLINESTTVIEPTSGNTGIALAALCALRGLKAVIVMPDNMSVERQRLIRAYGATLVLTDGKLGMAEAVRRAELIQKSTPNSFIAGQFVNQANPLAHYKTTGPELWRDLDGKIDAFIAGVGTGGTLSGTGRFLKEVNPSVKIIAVEPEASPLLSKGISHPHAIQGIGANFIPPVLDLSVCDEIITVSDQNAFEGCRLLGKREGVLAGVSSGAALWAAIAVAKRRELENKNIAVILPDGGDKYLSTALYE